MLLITSCGQGNNVQDKVKMSLTYEITPEDYDQNWYTVSWEDTLGQSEGYLAQDIGGRPKEVWCFITNQAQDTLGYYRGLSTATSFASFIATDTTVTLNFMIGLSMFPDKFQNDTTGASSYWQANHIPTSFEPIDVNIRTELREPIETVLKEK
ncbi:MAG: hypothetical protein ACOH13_04565 [Flavobacteriales bacterium]